MRSERAHERWRSALAVAVLAGAWVAVACSGPATAPAKPTEATSPAQQAQTGGTATIPIGADPTMNPWHPNAFVESLFVNRVLFAGLTSPGKDLAPASDLASSWQAAPDGLSWTFTLRDDVKWSDGRALPPTTSLFTFNDIILKPDLAATGRGNFSAVHNVEAVNPTTVKFNLSRPFSALPSYLAYNAGILPRHAFEGQADPWQHTAFNKGTPVYTGPFKVEQYTSGQSVILTRNDAYFGGKPNLDKLVFKVVPDANTQIAQALSGEISIMILDNKAAIDRVRSRVAGPRRATPARAVLLAVAESNRPALPGCSCSAGDRTRHRSPGDHHRRREGVWQGRQHRHRARVQDVLRPGARVEIPIRRRACQTTADSGGLARQAQTASCKRMARHSASTWMLASAACCSRPTSSSSRTSRPSVFRQT